MEKINLKPAEEFLLNIPSILRVVSGLTEEGTWWFKFQIDIQHPLAWNVVQELGHILNCISIEEKLPTSFYPVSPPSYLNGGPKDFLSWVIDNNDKSFTPDDMLEWLKNKLPDPIEDETEWTFDEEE